MQIQFRCSHQHLFYLFSRRAAQTKPCTLYLTSSLHFFYFAHPSATPHRVILCTYAIMQIMRHGDALLSFRLQGDYSSQRFLITQNASPKSISR
jgi:hypothetical protein